MPAPIDCKPERHDEWRHTELRDAEAIQAADEQCGSEAGEGAEQDRHPDQVWHSGGKRDHGHGRDYRGHGDRRADRQVEAASDQDQHLAERDQHKVDRLARHVGEVLQRQELRGDQSEDDQRREQEERQNADPQEQRSDRRNGDVALLGRRFGCNQRALRNCHAGTLTSAKKCFKTVSSEMAAALSSAEILPLEKTMRR